jgi:hypothetical protein
MGALGNKRHTAVIVARVRQSCEWPHDGLRQIDQATVDGLLAFAGKSEQGAVFTPVNPATLPANLRPGTSQAAPPQSTEPPVEDDPGTILPVEKKQLQNAAPAAAPQNQAPR